MTEQEYRALPNDEYFSFSFIKNFYKHGPQSLIKPKVFDNSGIKFGSLVDLLCFSEEEFEDIYYVSNTINELTKTEKKLYDYLISNIVITEDFINSDIFIKECLLSIKELKLWNNIKDEEKLKSKITDNFKAHILEYPISSNKTIISSQLFMDAKYTTKVLKEHDFTSEYFNTKDIKKKQVLFQIPILYTIKGDKFKSLLDIILIDVENKTIRALDLKTGAKSNEYFVSEFFMRRYDIQAMLYTKALEEYIVTNNLKDYTVLSPIYIYTCKFTPDVPLPFIIETDVIENAYTGYTSLSFREVKGVSQLVDEIKWHRKNNKYDYSVQQYKNKYETIKSINNGRLTSLNSDIFNNFNRRNSYDWTLTGLDVHSENLRVQLDRTMRSYISSSPARVTGTETF